MTTWPTLTLAQVCAEGGGFVRTGPFGAQLHKSDYVDDSNGVPVVMPKNMAGGSIDCLVGVTSVGLPLSSPAICRFFAAPVR